MKWISVKEVLPAIDPVNSTSEYVMVNDLNYGIMIAYFSCAVEKGFWTFKEERDSQDMKKANITHWQPLPKPPPKD